MSDYLKPLPVKAVAAWYYRLAASFANNSVQGATPLASVFLIHWLDNRIKGSVFKFDAPIHLKQNARVREVQHYHREVFLTNKKARIGKSEKWAGVVPRMQGVGGYKKWVPSSNLTMEYESLCDIAPNKLELVRIQMRGTAAERDLMTSLRGFQLYSKVGLTGKKLTNSKVQIQFTNWICKVLDTYDWNYKEYFTVPNPDYGSKDANAVQPDKQSIRVYHSNAKRIEDAGLAAPYKIESNIWKVSEATLVAIAEVDPAKKVT